MNWDSRVNGNLFARPRLGSPPPKPLVRKKARNGPLRRRRYIVDVDQLRELYERGLTQSQMSDELGVPEGTVAQELSVAFDRGHIVQRKRERVAKPETKKAPRAREMAKFADRCKTLPPSTPCTPPRRSHEH